MREDAAPLAWSGSALSPADDALLEDLSRRSFQFFWEQGDERTGLVRDRARTDGSPHRPAQRDVASIAATGFGLAALAVARTRGWMPAAAIEERVRRTVAFLARELPHEHGWFYHFVNARTGAREWTCELSSIDTALLLAGVLTVRQAFPGDRDITREAARVYDRVDFPWMLAGHPLLLSMGWTPESGFLAARWRYYCELMVLYLLGLGSPSHPLPRASWYAWDRPPRLERSAHHQPWRPALCAPVLARLCRPSRAPRAGNRHRLVDELRAGDPHAQVVLPVAGARVPGLRRGRLGHHRV